MTKQELIDPAKLIKQAQASQEKEAYVQIEKNLSCRIGMGARANTPTPLFFVEVIINLSADTGKVDLQRLENILTCLKTIKTRGYILTYEDNNCISCETKSDNQNLNKEITTIRKLIKENHL